MLDGMTTEERLASWHLVDGGQRSSAGAAFAPLLDRLGFRSTLGLITRFAPGLIDRTYLAVAYRRSRLGKLVTDGADRRASRRIEERA